MTKQPFVRLGKIAFDVALVCLVVGVVVQNRFLAYKLKGEEEILKGAQDLRPGSTVGGQLRGLAAVNFDGVMQPIATPEAGRKLLIIGMSPHCPFCKANEGGWAALTSALKQRADWRVLWVSRDPLEETKKYFGLLRMTQPDAMADPPFRTYEQLGLRTVPRTIAVLSGGNVDRIWTGELAPTSWREVFSYFGAAMPESLR